MIVSMQWIALLASLTLALPALGQDISGSVLDPSGKPLEGATLFVYTAKPRVGTASL
ncbi:MAG: hypothetical protein ACI8QC_003263 [Planctomycetota bacterium]|jgi:hypothetical protein